MNTFNTLFDKGIEDFQNGNYKGARDYFSRCIEIKPDNSNSYCNRGLMHYKLNQYSKAIEDFNRALALDPENLEAYFNRGLAKNEIGQHEEALQDLFLIKSINPNHPDLEEVIDIVKKKISGEVISYSFLRNMTYDGGNPEVALNRGIMAEQHEDLYGAISDYTNAISYKEDYVEAYLRRAKCYSTLKQYDKAITDYEKAEIFIKEKDVIKANIGNIYAIINKLDISLRYLDEAVQLNPKNPKNYYFRAQTKEKMGQNEGAFFDLTKCLELDPNDLNAIQQRGILRGNMKDYQGAINDFNKLIEFVPDEGMTYYNRAVTYYLMGEKEKCLNDLRKASSMGLSDADELIQEISATNKGCS